MAELTEDQARMLDFEARWYKYAGAKEAAIREQFDCSTTIYYQRLNVLIDEINALAYAPATVKRLRRLRDARRFERSRERLEAG